MTIKQFIQFDGQPPRATTSVTPRKIKTSIDDVKKVKSKRIRRLGFWILGPLALLLLAMLGISIALPIVLLQHATADSTVLDTDSTNSATNSTTNSTISTANSTIPTTNSTIPPTNSIIPPTSSTISTTNSTISTINSTIPPSSSTISTTNSTIPPTNSTISTTNSTISTTSSSIVTSTTVTCVFPYVLSSSGSCVNILIDINNCGSLGYSCSSNYTSCSAGVCSNAPAVQLANSNFIWTSGINGSVDDAYFGVTLPFNITIYNTTTDFVYVSSNGVICLGGCSNAYTETALPASQFPGTTVFPYWDDLYVYSNTSQGIYYATEGNAPNRTLTFEFYTSHYIQPSQYYHFQAIFFENEPGVVEFKYFESSDGGISCTIGVQASSSGPFIQYSYDQANSVQPNMTLIFNTNNNGSYTMSNFG